MQRWFRLLSAAALALALTACKADADVAVVIGTNGAGTVTVTLTADAEMVSEAPSLATDLRLDDLVASGWQVTGPSPTADGGLTASLVHPFASPEEATAVLAQLSGPDGPFSTLTVTQRQAFARVVTGIDGVIRVRGGVDAFADGPLLAKLGGALPYQTALAERGLTLPEAFSLRFAATVPGRAELSDGFAAPTEGEGFDAHTTVDWTADLAGEAGSESGQSITLEARLVDDTARRADRLREFAPWALAAWGALFLLVIVPIALLRRRHRRHQPMV